MSRSTLIQYVRDIDNKPIATLIAVKDPKDTKFQFGWSKYSIKKENAPFSKRTSKELALYTTKYLNLFILDNLLRKTLSRKNNFRVPLRYIPKDIEPAAAYFVQRASKYFKCSVGNVEFLTTCEYKTE